MIAATMMNTESEKTQASTSLRRRLICASHKRNIGMNMTVAWSVCDNSQAALVLLAASDVTSMAVCAFIVAMRYLTLDSVTAQCSEED